MKRSELQSMFGTERPILGMIHLPPSPRLPQLRRQHDRRH